jgi:hypothetical protein
MALTVSSLTAQNSTNSPYTRYGYGELANNSFGAGRSMGGVGIGLRSSQQINPMNPASYSSIDSMTFLFDFGASAQMSWYKDGTSSQSDVNGNVEYMAMQFPLHKSVAMSIGLLPYSHVGYKFGQIKTSNGLTYTESFEGQGGLNQLYAGLSISIWKKRLSFGANLKYLFGDISHNAVSVYSSQSSTYVSKTSDFKVKDAAMDFGLQYSHPLSKTDNLTFGLTYSPKTNLNNESYQMISSSEIVTDTLKGLSYDIPLSYGFGVSYEKNSKFIVVADISFQQWSKVAFESRNNEFSNRLKIATGGEWIPNLYSRPYLNRLRYRAGLSYANSYVKTNGSGYKELSATVGVGFPISSSRSFVNVSFDYTKIQPAYKSMVNEDYLRFTLSYTFNEVWFFKRKIN